MIDDVKDVKCVMIDGAVFGVSSCKTCPFHSDKCRYPTPVSFQENRLFPDDCPLYDVRV